MSFTSSVWSMENFSPEVKRICYGTLRTVTDLNPALSHSVLSNHTHTVVTRCCDEWVLYELVCDRKRLDVRFNLSSSHTTLSETSVESGNSWLNPENNTLVYLHWSRSLAFPWKRTDTWDWVQKTNKQKNTQINQTNPRIQRPALSDRFKTQCCDGAVKSCLFIGSNIVTHCQGFISVGHTDNVSQGPKNSKDWQNLKAVSDSDIAQRVHTKIAQAFSKLTIWLAGFIQFHSIQFLPISRSKTL